MLLLKEREGGGRERLLAPSVHVFCIPALIFTQSEAGVLSVQMKGEDVPFGGAMLRERRGEGVLNCVLTQRTSPVLFI